MAIAIILALIVFLSLKMVFNRNWKLVYTAFGHDDYFRVIGKLKQGGVLYKTKSPVNLEEPSRFKDMTQYDIYVKKEDEHIALNVLHNAN